VEKGLCTRTVLANRGYQGGYAIFHFYSFLCKTPAFGEMNGVRCWKFSNVSANTTAYSWHLQGGCVAWTFLEAVYRASSKRPFSVYLLYCFTFKTATAVSHPQKPKYYIWIQFWGLRYLFYVRCFLIYVQSSGLVTFMFFHERMTAMAGKGLLFTYFRALLFKT
jgi:hypothetical protein